jgi:hypothetical protein
VLGSVLVALLVAAVVAAPAAEAASYRYWTYWWGQPAATSWTFAQLGPASDRPKDGAVLGWRFAVTTEAGGRKSPRASLPFDSLCPALAAASAGAGEKRLAVVVDYGTASDAPPGEAPPGGGTVRVECVTVAANATGVTVLNAAGVSLRFGDNGLVCGIDRYPRTECAAVVADPTPSPKPTTAAPKPRPSTARPTTSATGGGSVATSAPAGTASAGEQSSSAPATEGSSTAPETTTSAPVPSTSDDPTTEAPLPVSSGAPVASGTEGGSGSSPVAPVLGIVLVAAVGFGAWWTARGRQA